MTRANIRDGLTTKFLVSLIAVDIAVFFLSGVRAAVANKASIVWACHLVVVTSSGRANAVVAAILRDMYISIIYIVHMYIKRGKERR